MLSRSAPHGDGWSLSAIALRGKSGGRWMSPPLPPFRSAQKLLESYGPVDTQSILNACGVDDEPHPGVASTPTRELADVG
jgi:hypothetical protein